MSRSGPAALERHLGELLAGPGGFLPEPVEKRRLQARIDQEHKGR